MTNVVLASASPRRHELLSKTGITFVVRSPDIDESPIDGEQPVDYVRRLASQKAAAAKPAAGELIIAADTTVDLDERILGKPLDDREAGEMLRQLSGRTHQVHTGVAVCTDGQEFVEVCTTLVTFVALDDPMIEWYIATGEPMDKAGAYALQGAGAALVSSVHGSVSNVIGLPMHVVLDLSRRIGVDLLATTAD
ncbi:MAG: Maf family protein [Ilumatobacteraceae bacterium]